MDKTKVGIIIGSDSDLPVMQEATRVLTDLGISWEIKIASAHRTPGVVTEYARTASERGLAVIIAGAGAAAHLAGVVASHTLLPVIGVPLGGSTLNGVDALYATVQMPRGIPVATMAINGARNAGIFAAQILAREVPEIAERLRVHREGMASEIEAKSAKLAKLGIDAYLARS